MNAKLSLQMTLLGLGVMVFYAGLLATGKVSMEILPHYAISAIIFLCSGIIGPRNGTVVAVLLLAALSVSATIFLIMELDRPYQGLINISGAPMRAALAQIGR